MAQRPNGQHGQSRLMMAALAYAERGWRVFPLHNLVKGGYCSCGDADCARGIAKHPRTKQGFKDASNRGPVIRAWWEQWPQANIGIATGARSGFIVLDIDPRDGGDASLIELQQRYGALPDSLTASTGGGGKHHLFQHPGGNIVLRNVTSLLTGIDIKADGGYIVAAPSLHASGAYYAWDAADTSASPDQDAESELPIASCPDWLLALLSRPREGEGTPVPHVTHDHRPNDGSATGYARIARYYLDKALERASEGTRNDTGFWLALQFRDAGMAEGEAEVYMFEYACSVPGTGYSEREAIASLRQAYRTAPRAAAIPRSSSPHGLYAPDVAMVAVNANDPAYAYTVGADTLYGTSSGERWGQQEERGQAQQEPSQDSHEGSSDAEGPKNNADNADEQRRARFRFMTDEEIENMQPPAWLMDGILPEKQLAVVYGEWGSCKSFLVQDWALSLATGRAWLGKHAVQQGIVAYIAGEGIGGMGRRIRAWKQHHEWQGPTGLYLVGQAPQLLQPGDVSDLVAGLEQLPAPPVAIVLDTLARSLVGGDENSAKDMGFAIAAADMLRNRFGALVILVHHKPNGAAKTRGSTALPGAANTQILVAKDGERVVVTCDKQKESAMFRPIHLRTLSVQLSEDDADDNSLVLIPATIDPLNPHAPTGLPASAEALLGLIHEGEGADLRTEALRAKWCDLTGQSNRNFYNTINTLIRAQLIRKMGEFWMVNHGG